MSDRLLSAMLTYVDQVAKSGSIQRAAKDLNIAASAIDRQILLLEADLGVSLFERMPRGMRLTPAGDAVVGLARRWSSDVRRLRSELKHLQGQEQGHIRIVAMDSHANTFLPTAVERLAREHPRISLEIEISSTDQAIQGLLTPDVDLGIIFNLPPHRELRVLWSEKLPFGCVVAPSHPLAHETSLTLQRAAKHPLVVQSRALMIRRYLEANHAWLLKQEQPPMTTNSLQLVKMLARSGRYVAFTSELDAAIEIAQGTLKFIAIRDTAAEPQSISIASSARRPTTRIVEIAAAFFQDAIVDCLAAARAAAT